MDSSSQEPELVTRAGFMPRGNDLHHATMHLEEAQAWSLKHDECAGFTYQSADPSPSGKVYVWFKAADKVAPGAGWHSCVKAGGARAGKPAASKLSLASVFSGGPKAPSSVKPMGSAISLLTRKPLHFEWWLNYHMSLGISHFFVHIEDTPELLPLLQSEPYRSRVTISQKGADSHFRDNYWTLQDRQRHHVNQSLGKCRELGIDWLFHVDDDELIWLDKPLREIVAGAPRGATNITFSNLEAIPTTIEPVNFFEHIRWFTKKRMLAYVNGKPVGRTLASVKLDGPHRFSGTSYAVPLTEGVILHYESCDFEQWCAKFRNQVDCTPERKASIPFPYYRDSISLFQQHPDPVKDRGRWVDFYAKRKINHYNTSEIKAGARHIPSSSTRTRMIELMPGAQDVTPALPRGGSNGSASANAASELGVGELDVGERS
mmetsp:Transcript_15654/g.39845  ORF Transcript_15654/g.39845 Transcript_15654/m.39845 type:complete len:432 (-) Transcript_15654:76-1371(-)